MNVYLSDGAAEGADATSRSERRSPAPAYASAAEADPGGGDPAAARTVAIPQQRQALAVEQRSSFARFKERAGAFLNKCSGKMLDGLLGGAPAGVYAAFAERTIREEDAAAGRSPARAATSSYDR